MATHAALSAWPLGVRATKAPGSPREQGNSRSLPFGKKLPTGRKPPSWLETIARASDCHQAGRLTPAARPTGLPETMPPMPAMRQLTLQPWRIEAEVPWHLQGVLSAEASVRTQKTEMRETKATWFPGGAVSLDS